MRDKQTQALTLPDVASGHRYGLLGLVVVMAAGLMLTACNTTAGAGQDISATGAAVTRGASDVKSKL